MFLLFLLVLINLLGTSAFKMHGETMLISSIETFDSVLESFDSLLVEFCDTSLEVCLALSPEFSQVARVLSEKESHIGFVKINFSDGMELHSKYEIRQFPSILLFTGKDKYIKYESHLVAGVLANWASKFGNPSCRRLTSIDAIEKFKASYPVIVIAFDDNENVKSLLEELSPSLENIFFGYVDDASLAAQANQSFHTVVTFKHFDEMTNVYDGRPVKDQLKPWIEMYSQPLVAHATRENLGSLFMNKNFETVFIYLNHDEESEQHSTIMHDLRMVAKDFRGRTVFTFIPESLGKSLMMKLRIAPQDLPAAVLYKVSGEMSNTFRLHKEINEENVREQLVAYFDGVLKPTIRSQPIPEENSGPVIELVGQTFNDFVLDDYFDVLVLFYSPYCDSDEPCQDYFQTVTQLGDHYRTSQTVKVAQMDLTKNDIDLHMPLQSLPTFVFFPANFKHKRLIYNGFPDFKSVQRFVYENYVLETPPLRPIAPSDDQPQPEAQRSHDRSEL